MSAEHCQPGEYLQGRKFPDHSSSISSPLLPLTFSVQERDLQPLERGQKVGVSPGGCVSGDCGFLVLTQQGKWLVVCPGTSEC